MKDGRLDSVIRKSLRRIAELRYAISGLFLRLPFRLTSGNSVLLGRVSVNRTYGGFDRGFQKCFREPDEMVFPTRLKVRKPPLEFQSIDRRRVNFVRHREGIGCEHQFNFQGPYGGLPTISQSGQNTVLAAAEPDVKRKALQLKT